MNDLVDKKITLFIPNLGGGGAERVIVNLANYFVEFGCDVEILQLMSNVESKYEIHPSVKLQYLKSSRILFSIIPLVRYIKTRDPDIFLSALSHANIASIIAGKIANKIKYIYVSEHGILKLTKTKNLISFLKSLLILFLVKKLYPNAKKIIAVSDVVKRVLVDDLKIPSVSIERIYNPVAISTKYDSEGLLPIGWINDGMPVIISAGRFGPEKDFRTLLMAIKLVLDKIKVRLVLLGEGGDFNKIAQYAVELNIQNYVQMPGFVSDLNSWFYYSDIFVLSSPSESFGNVIVEAMNLNIPIIATDCGGPREILEDGKWGEIVPIGDPHSMAVSIFKILSKKNKSNLKDRASYFSIENQGCNYLNLFFSDDKSTK